MTLAFLQSAVLFGLAALAIPVLIHLWNRRRPQEVAWGAMQFLRLTPSRKRRLMLEELLLLALRLGLVALIVCGLAGPVARGPLANALAAPRRDVVFVVDGSASMGRTDVTPTPWDAALAWVRSEVATLGPGDRWALAIAQEPPTLAPLRSGPWMGDDLPSPAGAADGPGVVARARKLLRETGEAPLREIVVVTDGQRHGWADAACMRRWSAPEDDEPAPPAFRWHVVPTGPADAKNVGVVRWEASRKVVVTGQRVRFVGEIEATGPMPAPKLTFAIDGDPRARIDDAAYWKGASGQVRFEATFSKPGVHVATLAASPSDAYPADQTRDAIVEVLPEIDLLVVDGGPADANDSTYFYLSRAFAVSGASGDGDRASPIAPRRVALARFGAGDLTPAPRALFLTDVERLAPAQAEAISSYARAGGGVCVVLGERTAVDGFDAVQRTGEGAWFPVRLLRSEAGAALVDGPRSRHRALTAFERDGESRLGAFAFKKGWKTATLPGAVTAAWLTNGDPWLVEKPFGAGRVLTVTTPFDRTSSEALVAAWEFPVLAHELAYALADVGAGRFVVEPGRPVRLAPERFAPPWRPSTLPAPAVVRRVGGGVRTTALATWPALLDAPGPAGTYRVRVADGPEFPLVVVGDPGEADLTPLTEPDRRAIGERAKLGESAPPASEHDAWRWFFLAAMVVLCLETGWTRRMGQR